MEEDYGKSPTQISATLKINGSSSSDPFVRVRAEYISLGDGSFRALYLEDGTIILTPWNGVVPSSYRVEIVEELPKG